MSEKEKIEEDANSLNIFKGVFFLVKTVYKIVKGWRSSPSDSDTGTPKNPLETW